MTPVMIWLAKKMKAMDYPLAKLKPQKQAIPNLGGMAIFFGFSLTLLCWSLIGVIPTKSMVGILSSSLFIMIIGFLDDKYDLKGFKLLAHIFIGVLLAMSGIHFNFISHPILKILTTVGIVVIACNSLNLIDGIDGLAAGVVLIASTFFFILFVISGNMAGFVLSLALIGSTSAFLIFNFSPASIYLGNNGSLFLGLIIAVMMLIYPTSKNFNFILAPMIIFAIPIADTALSFTRRMMNGRSFLHGDRSHFYDHLVRNGHSLKKVILVIYIICSLLGGTAILITAMPLSISLILFFVITLIFMITILKLKFYRIID